MADLIERGYAYAAEVYAEKGVDVARAMARCADVAISMHCWQGDDIMGCESAGAGASGGIQTTGNYPGRARDAKELRADLDVALAMIPGRKKLNLHGSYAELEGRMRDRDAYTAEDFKHWIAWAREKGLGLDINPTYFSHPYAADGFTLSHPDRRVRDFWIEHGRRCREIAEAFARALGQPSVVNVWVPDGYKDVPADTTAPRARMIDSLDKIYQGKADTSLVLDAVESKLFGIGVESYTVGSHELLMGYALSRGKLYTLDSGHYHPTEQIADKISSLMLYLDRLHLHVTRGVRWDSDHVVTLSDDLQTIMNEIVFGGYIERVLIGLDYFDASINRVAAWVIGMRNAQKALLRALLTPHEAAVEAERTGDFTARLVSQEEAKTLPFAPVWDMYCRMQNVPVGDEWLTQVRKYEREVMLKR
ncbi:MAG: L-rhamnose isomerase [Christensenellaceae bacterium]|nr:L-rhamnose isomerase [Christensenellaceae bacterium]